MEDRWRCARRCKISLYRAVSTTSCIGCVRNSRLIFDYVLQFNYATALSLLVMLLVEDVDQLIGGAARLSNVMGNDQNEELGAKNMEGIAHHMCWFV